MTDIEKVLAIVEQLDVCEIMICKDCPLFNLCYKKGGLINSIKELSEWLDLGGKVWDNYRKKVYSKEMVYPWKVWSTEEVIKMITFARFFKVLEE